MKSEFKIYKYENHKEANLPNDCNLSFIFIAQNKTK